MPRQYLYGISYEWPSQFAICKNKKHFIYTLFLTGNCFSWHMANENPWIIIGLENLWTQHHNNIHGKDKVILYRPGFYTSLRYQIKEMAAISKSHQICSKILFHCEFWSLGSILSEILFILMKFSIKLETLAISLSFISHRALFYLCIDYHYLNNFNDLFIQICFTDFLFRIGII